MRPPRPVSASLTAVALLCASAAPGCAPSGRERSRVPVPAVAAALAAQVSAVPAGKLGASLRAGCPVPAERLRLVRMNHWGFDGRVHRGELVVHQDAVEPLLYVFGRALEARFPIRRMRVAADYGGDDLAAMADDNTSAFNCRPVTGDAGRLSRHSWGLAVDVNPVENPYVDRRGTVHPPAGRAHLRRDPARPGTITGDGVLARAFRRVGWHWGGEWWSSPDYQHFSADGR
ncbi:M15 family metallopeptidase [Streptomyces katrae]|uniref:M15 family metallopeptidase n=1 Tax=Streptomyces katrae TaxID=68223 RepID=A0ABT7H0Y8_9ACTN|nr:M15 family metallopeptidase [Streptomyces katrae]MDK9499488.1 M15 family metallopeptidase [Streptomyces katrae]